MKRNVITFLFVESLPELTDTHLNKDHIEILIVVFNTNSLKANDMVEIKNTKDHVTKLCSRAFSW